jgi:hypothetical protein
MIKRTVLSVVLSLAVSPSALFAQTTVCNDSAIMALRGKWTAPHHAPRPSPQEVTNEQYLQAAKRADAIHPLLLEAYPELVGMQEGRWWHSVRGPSFFVTQLLAYNYIGGLSQYFCAPNASPGSILGKLGAPSKPVYVPEAAETNLIVHFNNFGDPDYGFLRQIQGLTVNGLQVFHRLRPAGTWKGYELYATKFEMDGLVLLTRKGMLPYRPVTRKQYLEYMIATIQRNYADAASLRDELTARYREELKKNAADKTLDSPAIVAGIGKIRFSEDPDIFTTEEKDGQALVTVNPDYVRKDLPPYMPQFMVVHWQWQVGVASSYFRKMVETNLPIEKFQAMIDR